MSPNHDAAAAAEDANAQRTEPTQTTAPATIAELRERCERLGTMLWQVLDECNDNGWDDHDGRAAHLSFATYLLARAALAEGGASVDDTQPRRRR